MSDPSIRSIPLLLDTPLAGLEALSTCQLRPLPLQTIFSFANRRLKPEFPPQRDYELYLDLVNKGLLDPQFSRAHLQTLPLKTLEELAHRILRGTLSTDSGSPLPESLDRVLTLVIALEETQQFNLSALVSEDLALLESHHEEAVQSYFFKPNRNPDHLAFLLQTLGYDTRFLHPGVETDPLLAYWICRQITTPFPWTRILAHFTEEQAGHFPYVYRLSQIARMLMEHLPLVESFTPEHVWDASIPTLTRWIREQFPVFSQSAHIPRPIQELVLVEGSTEALLLPAIAKALGVDLDYEGILVQPVGGKNQMLQQYVDYAEHMAVPITIVMDRDAQPLLPDLAYYQRPIDQIIVLKEGEFEDLYAPELIIKTLNEHYHPTHPITLRALAPFQKESKVKALQALWQSAGLGVFDKVEFAQHLALSLTHPHQLSPAMSALIQTILDTKTNAPTPLPNHAEAPTDRS